MTRPLPRWDDRVPTISLWVDDPGQAAAMVGRPVRLVENGELTTYVIEGVTPGYNDHEWNLALKKERDGHTNGHTDDRGWPDWETM